MGRLALAAGLVLALAAGCGGGAAGSSPSASVAVPATPLARSWRDVGIAGGSPGVRRAVRAILRGLDRTALRRIDIRSRRGGGPPHGVEFDFTVAAPDAALGDGVLAMHALWEADVVDVAYASARRGTRLPRLVSDWVAARYPSGRVQGLFGGKPGGWGTPVSPPPAQRIRRSAERAAFELAGLRYVHVPGLAALPVVIVATRDHRALVERLGRFFAGIESGDRVPLAYVELDSSCGRPVFAQGYGIAKDPRWFDPCAFTACPAVARPAPRRTYPCRP